MPDGRIRRELLPPSEWDTFIKDAHPGYITWDEFERIQQRMQEDTLGLLIEGRRATSPAYRNVGWQDVPVA